MPGLFGLRDIKKNGLRMLWAHSEKFLRQEGTPNTGFVLRRDANLPWLSKNPFYTKRFNLFVGRRCRTSNLKEVAKELHLDWKTVKTLDKQYV